MLVALICQAIQIFDLIANLFTIRSDTNTSSNCEIKKLKTVREYKLKSMDDIIHPLPFYLDIEGE